MRFSIVGGRAGRGGKEFGRMRFVYSSSLMSEVRVRPVRFLASGGKVGRVKDWRGICATWAWEGGTGSWDSSCAVFWFR